MSAPHRDVVELLTEQHEQIRTMFTEVESASGAAKQESFERLRRFLAVHETAEELVTHPNVRTAAGGNEVLDARLEEETQAKKLLAGIDGMDVSDPAFDAKFTVLREAVLHHAAAEEREEFPLLLANNSERTLDLMARGILAAEALAPTHPHPSVGSSMTTNLMAGPLASVIDRTRDAVKKAMS